jgi:hypothetical protein
MRDPGASAQSPASQDLNEPRDGPVLWRRVAVQIDRNLIDIAPGPAFRRIVALNDWMSGGVKMLARVLAGRLIAAAHVPAVPADPQMHPFASGFKALLAASRAGLDLHNGVDVGTLSAHAFTFQATLEGLLNGPAVVQ